MVCQVYVCVKYVCVYVNMCVCVCPVCGEMCVGLSLYLTCACVIMSVHALMEVCALFVCTCNL